MVTQRSIAQAFLALQAVLTTVLAVVLTVEHNPHAWAGICAAAIYGACFIAFRRGWEPARQVVVITLTALLVAATHEPYLTVRPSLGVLLPPIAALMLTSSRWIIASAVLSFFGLVARAGFNSPLLHPIDCSVTVMAVSGLVLVRRSVDIARLRLEAQVERADAARRQAEAAAQEAIAERDRATRLEAALLHLQRLESVGRLAGGVAHDFNNLLTVIGASASMAERALASGGSAADELNEVHLAVARASELTKQLLAFARKQVLVKRNVELTELVSSVERMLRRLIGEGTSLSAKLTPEPLRVMADAGQVEQVIVNLVINARDAITGTGKIELVTSRLTVLPGSEADLEGLTSGDYACIEVRDDGVGMSRDVQQRLFEPFFTTKAQGRGTGLGLATSFGIVRQHEGTIRVESAPGKGTRMRVLLPLAAGASSEKNALASGVVPVAAPRQRVLVVEDEPQVRAIAARALTLAGFEVLQAGNGATALTMIQEQTQPFDLIVTDVVMPALSGPELARAVRALDPEMALVFMSGFPEAMHNAHADEFPDAAFLTKPFSPQKLVEVTRERLEIKTRNRQATHS